MEMLLRNVQYHTGGEAVALLVETPLGAFYVTTTQSALDALAPTGLPWSDAEALAAAQTGVDARFPDSGYVVTIPTPPAPDELPAPPAPDPAP